MPVEKLKKFLDARKVKYVSIKHSLAYTAHEIAASTHIHGKEIAKTVIVKTDDKFAMAVLPANYRVAIDLLKKASGATHAEIAGEEEFKDLFPGCDLGAMPPFGNLYDMNVYVDKSLSEDEDIAFNAGSHTELIRMPYKDFIKLVNPRVVNLTA